MIVAQIENKMPNEFGTAKQAELIITLGRRLQKMTPELAEMYRKETLVTPQKEVAAKIDELNAQLGFFTNSSDATPRQRVFIGALELQLHGQYMTTPKQFLSFSDADVLIKSLKQQLAAQERPSAATTAAPAAQGNVIDIFSIRNAS